MLQVKLEKFEGPLSLLLQLIKKEEMDITQVSLAKIADQYVDYVRGLTNADPDEMANFLAVASRLLLIKSRALLPFLYPEEEEQYELEQQLRMYKEFLEAAERVEKMIGKKKFMFTHDSLLAGRKAFLAQINLMARRAGKDGENIFSPPKKLTANDLKNVLEDILRRIKPAEELEEQTIESKISIEDQINAIQKMLAQRIQFNFNKILSRTKSKTEIIVSFLAMLELIKQKEVVVIQEGLFKEMVISRNVFSHNA